MSNWLIATTLDTSLLIGLVVLIRPVIRRGFGARVAYGLWLIPLIGALLPARPTRPALPFEAIRLSGAEISGQIYSAAESWATPSTVAWEWLWLLGAAALLAIQILRIARFGVRVRATAAAFGAPPHLLAVLERFRVRAKRVFTTKLDGAPFAMGLMNPEVFLPDDFLARFPADEQRWILEHELTHIRRGDLWGRLVAEAFRVVFWFNPIIHLAVRAVRQDQEYACDEAVVGRCTGEERYRYGKALIFGSLPQRSASLVGFFGHGKERYVMLGKYRKSTVRTLVGTVVCGMIGAYSLTSAPFLAAQDAASAGYDMKSVVEMQGGVFRFTWLPDEDSTLGLMVPNQAGKLEEWTVVLEPWSELKQSGFDRTLGTPGGAVIVTGHPSLVPGKHRLLALTVTRPGGAAWSR